MWRWWRRSESKSGMERNREREGEHETEREKETQAGGNKRKSEHGTERESARARCRCPFHKAVSAERSIESHGTNDELRGTQTSSSPKVRLYLRSRSPSNATGWPPPSDEAIAGKVFEDFCLQATRPNSPVLPCLPPLTPLPLGRAPCTHPLPLPLSTNGQRNRAPGAWTPQALARPRFGRPAFCVAGTRAGAQG